MADASSVFQALAAVSAEVGAVAKSRKAAGADSYRYRGIEDVMNALHGPLAEHGVILVPRVVEASQELDPYKLGDKGWNRTRVTVEYDVYGPDGSSLPQPLRVVGDALDNSDKGWGKAMSYAYKTALGQLFTLPTEEDNEATAIPEAKAASRRQQQQKPAPVVPDGEPFDDAEQFASPEAVDALLADIRNSSEQVRDELKAFIADKKLPSLSQHREDYPQPFFDLVDGKLAELQDKADGK